MKYRYETTEYVLDEQFSNTCSKTKATTSFIWSCASPFHTDDRHYYVRTV